MSLLTVENLDVFYGDFQAVRGVSLAVEEGRTVAIIGANGAGKSTLLNAVVGLHGQKRGRVRFAGADVTFSRADAIARAGMTMVPEGRRLFGTLSVEDNLRVGAAAGRKGPWTLDEIYRLFPRIGELRHMAASSLSGGQQQMVAIGRALMTNPKILLCDEISLGLAPKVILDIYRCFEAIGASGVSIVVIEQNVAQACAAAQYAYCMLEGQVGLEGPTADLSMEAITAAYFGLNHA
ncbi:MAG: ABC transporter ATP-binding protein [Rhizobiaceae bacterium]|nr:MAG: ABC transporter ATP-binding protein [Rhizobiaceae bacterium]CAG1006817.1 High-affinity branched-chain amino acid transport ATP-binding protein LivF [Rhizobiaceae bacterium]